jgi:hypothetical protein
MHEGTFAERRRIRPLDNRVGRIVGYRMREPTVSLNSGYEFLDSVSHAE